jgi:hypothetical protein
MTKRGGKMPIFRYNNGGTVNQIAKRWNGSNWVDQIVRRKQGNDWVVVSGTLHTWNVFGLKTIYPYKIEWGGTANSTLDKLNPNENFNVYPEYSFDEDTGEVTFSGEEDGILDLGSGYGGNIDHYFTQEYGDVRLIYLFTQWGSVVEDKSRSGRLVKDESNPQGTVTSYSQTAYPDHDIKNGLYYEFVS